MPSPYYICVDTETAGPNPGSYSLLSIGAVSVEEPEKHFYVELRPVQMAMTEESARVHQLKLEDLANTGVPPKDAMARFDQWVGEVSGNKTPIFVAFNAPFDWMFVADYFERFLVHNPFGHRALDIKALYMGLQRVQWEGTSYAAVSQHYDLPQALAHNALKDAQQAAQLFAAMLAEFKETSYER